MISGTSKQHPYETDIRVPFIIRGPGINPGTNITSALAGNVDLMPTILDLVGINPATVEGEMDGKSMKDLLFQTDPENTSFRQYFLNEYYGNYTCWNDHSTIWQDGHKTSMLCKTGLKSNSGPISPDPTMKNSSCVESKGIGDGNCWIIDSRESNNWRQLRIMNDTMNWSYVEYDPKWEFNVTDESGSGLQHYELYDVDNDPYQIDNIYSMASYETKVALHLQLDDYFRCQGKSCP